MMRADRGFVLLLAAAALVTLVLTQISFLLPAVRTLIASPFEQAWNFCMNGVGPMRSHVLYLTISAAVATFVAIVVPGLASATRKVRRTRALMSNVLRNEIPCLPAPLAQLAAKAGLAGRVRFVDHADFYAFTYGWLRPQVCISSVAVVELSPDELEALLRHEAYHVRRRDPLRLLIGQGLSAALYFLPVVKEFVRLMILKAELRADASVVRGMGGVYALAGALSKAVRSSAAHPGTETAIAAFSLVDARTDQLVNSQSSGLLFRPTTHSVIVSLLSLLATAALICVFIALWQVGDSIQACPSC